MSDISKKLSKIAHELSDLQDKPSSQELAVLLVNNLNFFTELSPAVGYLEEAGLNDKTLYLMSKSAIINAFDCAAEFAANPL